MIMYMIGGSLPCGGARNVLLAWRANEIINGFGVEWLPIEITSNTDIRPFDCFIIAHLQVYTHPHTHTHTLS
jgi:hypothetical protein